MEKKKDEKEGGRDGERNQKDREKKAIEERETLSAVKK